MYFTVAVEKIRFFSNNFILFSNFGMTKNKMKVSMKWCMCCIRFTHAKKCVRSEATWYVCDWGMCPNRARLLDWPNVKS